MTESTMAPLAAADITAWGVNRVPPSSTGWSPSGATHRSTRSEVKTISNVLPARWAGRVACRLAETEEDEPASCVASMRDGVF